MWILLAIIIFKIWEIVTLFMVLGFCTKMSAI